MDKLAVGPDEAAKMIGVGRAHMFALLADNRIPSFRLGRRRLISVEALRLWVERKAQEAQVS